MYQCKLKDALLYKNRQCYFYLFYDPLCIQVRVLSRSKQNSLCAAACAIQRQIKVLSLVVAQLSLCRPASSSLIQLFGLFVFILCTMNQNSGFHSEIVMEIQELHKSSTLFRFGLFCCWWLFPVLKFVIQSCGKKTGSIINKFTPTRFHYISGLNS